MHPAARIFLGLFALWSVIKTLVFFIAAERTRRHLSEAPSEIRKTLRFRMIGGYGMTLINVAILVVIGAIAIKGSASLIKDFRWPLIVVFVVGAMAGSMGIKASFDSLHNASVDDFNRRYVNQVPRLFRGSGVGTEGSKRE